MAMKDYRHGCPMCGVSHRPGTIVGLSGMNRKCAARWERMSEEQRKRIIERSRSI